MKFHYFHETDSLYIDLSEKTSVDSQEVAPGVILDFDADGHLVGIDIDHASQVVDLSLPARLIDRSRQLGYAKACLGRRRVGTAATDRLQPGFVRDLARGQLQRLHELTVAVMQHAPGSPRMLRLGLQAQHALTSYDQDVLEPCRREVAHHGKLSLGTIC